MTETVRSKVPPNRVLENSIKHPVRMMIILFVIAVILKILDSFVFRLGDLLGELIFTKALGFVMLIVYLSMCGRKLRDVGFHQKLLGKALLISGVCVGGLYVISYISQLIALRAGGEDARFVLSAVDPKTGMTGGLWFGVWLFFGNLVNSAMEEGLFRGAMIRHFRIKLSSGARFCCRHCSSLSGILMAPLNSCLPVRPRWVKQALGH